MTVQTAIITLVAAILSGVLATAITLFVNAKMEEKQIKRQLVKDIFGSRYVLSSKSSTLNILSTAKDDFCKAINEVPIVFSKNKKVMEAYDEFYRAIREKSENSKSAIADDKLITLVKEMCDASGINCNKWNDSRIKNVFNL